MAQKVFFEKGPKIGVHFVSEGEGLRVLLTESDRFQAVFFTEVNEGLRLTILSWMKDYGLGIYTPVNFLPRQKAHTFTEKALTALSDTKIGEKISYSELASLADSPKAVRAAGTVCRSNQYPLFIPCHRVLSKGGGLGGFAFGSQIKTLLLEFEEESTR